MTHSTWMSPFLMLLLVTSLATAQQGGVSPPEPLPIPVNFVATRTGDGVAGPSVEWVEDGVRAAMPAAGLASLAGSPLLLQLRISTRSRGTSDAGMRAVELAEAAVTLELLDPMGRGVVASSRLTQAGNGRDLASATSQALSQIANDHSALHNALRQLGTQASRAFEIHCGDVLASATRLASERDFDAAIGLTMGVPVGAPRCRTRAQAMAKTLYTQRVRWQCGTAIQQGRAAQAVGDFEAAIDALRYVDPLSPCRTKVAEMLRGIGEEAHARSARDAAERAEALRMEWGLRRESIHAISDIEGQRLAVLGWIATEAMRRRR